MYFAFDSNVKLLVKTRTNIPSHSITLREGKEKVTERFVKEDTQGINRFESKES
ncbi:MAG: hypothetical protein JO327_05705 [Nitrososphaeraceae archaeon]|nr:hypothetical protein [Nitrososphaeraceae archaeon]MBV9667609.1 hypothetical protein [Nitrososphaeraceae archaeon]